MNALLTTDLHLTTKTLDEYRWDLFPWLIDQQIRTRSDALFLLGDITDDKDYHSSRLVNRVVDTFAKLCRQFKQVIIIRGNHDGLDPDCPYFRFLSFLPNVSFIFTPYMAPFGSNGKKVLMLPHTRDPLKDWEHVQMYDAEFILMHATVHGAISENGHELEGLSPEYMRRRAPHAKIYSGDVHVPQNRDGVEYIGTPYQVRFGTQQHQCRVLLLENFGRAVDLHFETLWRYILDVVPTAGEITWPEGLRKGDQIKVRLHLHAHEYGDWNKHRKVIVSLCEKQGLELCELVLVREKTRVRLQSPSAKVVTRGPKDIFDQYCTQQKVEDTLRKAGEEILHAVQV